MELKTPESFENYARLEVFIGRECVAYANLSREMSKAVLHDIYVYDRSKTVFFIFNTGNNYRRQGIGTTLLLKTIDFCKQNEIETIGGILTEPGDLSILIPWYTKHGFTLDSKNTIQYKI